MRKASARAHAHPGRHVGRVYGPPDEAARLQVLCASGLEADCLNEDLAHLLQLARETFGVSAVLLSAVGAETQFFPARLGFGSPETSRAASFCAATLHGADTLVVPDAREDARFSGTELVTATPHIRFYAGASVKLHPGHAVGAFCIIDDRPRRDFSQDDRLRLQEFAALAELQMQLHVAHTAALGTEPAPPRCADEGAGLKVAKAA